MPAQTHWSVPRQQLPIVKKLTASQLRCSPGYRHNDITVLIIGKPNSTAITDEIIMPDGCHYVHWFYARSVLFHLVDGGETSLRTKTRGQLCSEGPLECGGRCQVRTVQNVECASCHF